MITFKLQLIALFLIINCGLTFTVIYSAQWHSVTLCHQIVFSDFSVVCLVLDLIYTNQGVKFSPSAISVQSQPQRQWQLQKRTVYIFFVFICHRFLLTLHELHSLISTSHTQCHLALLSLMQSGRDWKQCCRSSTVANYHQTAMCWQLTIYSCNYWLNSSWNM